MSLENVVSLIKIHESICFIIHDFADEFGKSCSNPFMKKKNSKYTLTVESLEILEQDR